MRDDIIKLEKKKLSLISWAFKYASADSSLSTIVSEGKESPPKGQCVGITGVIAINQGVG
jgi:hypothetical protein